MIGLVVLAGIGRLGADEPQPSETFRPIPDQSVDVSNGRNLYVIGYSHLDTQWRWSYPQVVREFVANTLQHNFRLLEKYPNYRFNFSGSRRYEMMAEYYPDDFAKLKSYIAEGRWFPAGSSVDEADSIVPSAESLLRQILYGNHYFRREFGVASDEFMLPDCFGFPYALPTILAHAGIKGFSTQKLTWGSPIGIPFKVGVWEGPDGNSVVAALDPGSYTGAVTDDLSHSESWLKRIENTGAVSKAYVDFHYYGTGDRGGAPPEDSVKWVERSLAGNGPVHVISARADQMFHDLRPENVAALPRYKGELLLTQHSAGSITSQAYMKRWNRKNELLADAAERASVAAWWLGGAPYPSKKLYDAWDLLLGSQMHDMLPGTSIPKAYEFCWNDELLAANQFGAALQQGVGVVAAAMNTEARGVPLVVFNPVSVARDDAVEATIQFPNETPETISVFDADGKEVPAQVIARNGREVTVVFVASLQPVSFATFDVRAATGWARKSALRVSDHELENERYRVTVDAAGDVSSIYDKRDQRELLASPARLAFLSEKPADYPAWNMDWADRRTPPRSYVDGPAEIKIVENGPARVALQITREAEGSRFVQIVRLAAGGAGDRVEFVNRIDWQTPQSSLKAVFPLTQGNPLATYDSQVGTLERGNNNPGRYEAPQHQWFDLTSVDGRGGVAIVNDCKFGSDKPDDNTLRLTLLYTPGVRSRYQDQASQDFGRHDVTYALVGHAGNWREGRVPWHGSRLNQPLLAFQVPAHDGPLGKTYSLFSVSADNVMIQAIKKAEDSDETIVRVRELFGRASPRVQLKSSAAIVAARELDGQERPLRSVTLNDGKVEFAVGAYALRTFALKLAPAVLAVPRVESQPVALEFNDDVVSGNGNRADGHFDDAARAYPAEQFPTELTSEGIVFHLGPTADGKLNAVAARGQTLALPAGDFDRAYVLAAADGDVAAEFSVDGKPIHLTVQHWTDYIGQWDNRSWDGEVPLLAYAWFNRCVGLAPGYFKPATVAWHCSHRHSPTGDDHYRYSYLFKYPITLSPGAHALTLPNNPKVRIFAISVARHTHDEAVAATPLFDQLQDHLPDAPRLPYPNGEYADALTVSITHPLYWREGRLRYTLDGSAPTPRSAVYKESITLNRDTTVTAAEVDDDGQVGPTAKATYRINDVTSPRVVDAVSVSTAPAIRVTFSEPVERSSAENPQNYSLSGNTSVDTVHLEPDDHTVTLGLSKPLVGSAVLKVQGIRDVSPQGNRMEQQESSVELALAVFSEKSVPAESIERSMKGLPVGHAQPWTMNVFVRASRPMDNRTLIVGFGAPETKRTGVGRYFGNFGNGLHLAVRGGNLESSARLKVNTWQMLTASYDGEVLRFYIDGELVGFVEQELSDDEAVVRLRPLDPWDHERRFDGEIRDFAIWDRALSPSAVALMYTSGREK